jgi:hypothetical protein
MGVVNKITERGSVILWRKRRSVKKHCLLSQRRGMPDFMESSDDGFQKKRKYTHSEPYKENKRTAHQRGWTVVLY